jgi:hypothetical protein
MPQNRSKAAMRRVPTVQISLPPPTSHCEPMLHPAAKRSIPRNLRATLANGRFPLNQVTNLHRSSRSTRHARCTMFDVDAHATKRLLVKLTSRWFPKERALV